MVQAERKGGNRGLKNDEREEKGTRFLKKKKTIRSLLPLKIKKKTHDGT